MTQQRRQLSLLLGLGLLVSLPAPGRGEDGGSSDLAKQLANPIASLISLPFQFNWDEGYGVEGDGERLGLNIQPVVPVGISEHWNMISRTIVPLAHQDDYAPGDDSDAGLGDVVQSLFFSPKQATKSGLVWGVGPVFALPTATDDALGSKKWSVGPTVVMLKQSGHWTAGFLGNHLWSVAGDDDRSDVNASFLQPFLSYTTGKAVTASLNVESTYDWGSGTWNVPINGFVSKLVRVGRQPISIGGGLRYWAESPDGGADDLGLRFQMTWLFPKK